MLCLNCVKTLFKNSKSYMYFITIKPPCDDNILLNIYDFCEYMKKRSIRYWLVRCQSQNGYIHFHGLVSFKETQTPLKGPHGALIRQVNRKLGYVTCLPIQTDVVSVYTYIRSDRNNNCGLYQQEDLYSPYVVEHKCF